MATQANQIPIEMQIWKAADIAAYLGLSKRYVAENLVYQQGFPRPMKRICKHRQWKAADVIRWRENPPPQQARKQGGLS